MERVLAGLTEAQALTLGATAMAGARAVDDFVRVQADPPSMVGARRATHPSSSISRTMRAAITGTGRALLAAGSAHHFRTVLLSTPSNAARCPA